MLQAQAVDPMGNAKQVLRGIGASSSPTTPD